MKNNKLAILYTCDNNYIPLTAISIASVIYNNQDKEISFYIATETSQHEYFDKLVDFYKDNKKVTINHIDLKKYDYLLSDKKLDKWGSNSYYVYWKLFAYDYFDEDYVWYIDSDVICISKIDNPKIDKTIGAVIDSAHADFNKVAGIDENYYFYNTGTLFIDIKKWKANKCIDKVVDYITNMKQLPLMCDQDILAQSLQNEIEPINPKYNYFVGYDYYGVDNSFAMYSLDNKPFYKRKEIKEAKDNIIFYHCLGGVFGRPWQKDNYSPIKDEFDKYRKMSPWVDYSTDNKQSLLFKVESFLEFLPDNLYNKIHNFAMRRYLRRLRKVNN